MKFKALKGVSICRNKMNQGESTPGLLRVVYFNSNDSRIPVRVGTDFQGSVNEFLFTKTFTGEHFQINKGKSNSQIIILANKHTEVTVSNF